MKNLTIALALALSAPLLYTPAASATDTRPCVSKAEYHAHRLHGMDRSALEREWDVRHLGRQGTMSSLIDPGPDAYIVDYPACGFGDDSRAGVSVFYKMHTNTVKFAMRWRETGYGPNGHPRVVLTSP